MANALGLIHESIWRNDDWRELSRGAQALYMQLLSQKEVDCAGVLPLLPTKWAKGCAGLTTEQVMADMEELQRHRFVYYDEDTDEALIRTYIRNSNVMKVPNMRKSARRAATLVASPKIRAILAAELRATSDPECLTTADEIDPEPSNRTAHSKQIAEPLRNPSVTLPEGSGKGKGKGVSNLSSTQGGSARPQCSKHPNSNSEDAYCRGCMNRRKWDERHAADMAADELDAKRRSRDAATQAVRDCPCCDTDGWTLGADGTPADPARKCEHRAAAHA
jgi:hypothetical protein